MSDESPITLVSAWKSFDGEQRIYSHFSRELQCPMRFGIYIPAGCSPDNRMPVVYWLSGLTCTEMNFIEKAGAQRYASELGLIIVSADTSPRQVNLPGEDEAYDFGSGAGFYVDATEEPWKQHYRMYSYVTVELIDLITSQFPVIPGKQSITGHSMGGHGSLVCALRNPGLYRSVSAFAPIANPSNCAWGRKAFTGYLGPDESVWAEWDATALIAKYKSDKPLNLLIEQGLADAQLAQLQPSSLVAAAKSNNVELIFNERQGYDHSYYFIASFIGKHLAHHSAFLK